jgi:hypothetical protein
MDMLWLFCDNFMVVIVGSKRDPKRDSYVGAIAKPIESHFVHKWDSALN